MGVILTTTIIFTRYGRCKLVPIVHCNKTDFLYLVKEASYNVNYYSHMSAYYYHISLSVEFVRGRKKVGQNYSKKVGAAIQLTEKGYLVKLVLVFEIFLRQIINAKKNILNNFSNCHNTSLTFKYPFLHFPWSVLHSRLKSKEQQKSPFNVWFKLRGIISTTKYLVNFS